MGQIRPEIILFITLGAPIAQLLVMLLMIKYLREMRDVGRQIKKQIREMMK